MAAGRSDPQPVGWASGTDLTRDGQDLGRQVAK